ncbi:MAG: RluA family pseudouridine synthase [Mycoplasma sp.]
MNKLVVKDNDVNWRIDKFIRKVYPSLKLSEVYKFLRNKKIKVNNKKVRPDYRLNLNDEITCYFNAEVYTKQVETKDLKQEFSVIYEDKNILVVYKPAGLVVHIDHEKTTNTLINQVLNYLISKNEYDPKLEQSFAPSLVNRIDRNTAGLVMIAKNRKSLDILNEKIKLHEINKTYLAKVYGIIDPKQAIKKAFLTKFSDKNQVLITPKPINPNSKEIITEYKLIEHKQNQSLIEINLITGRTHQIRAHFNYLGYPLVGEQKYTKNEFKHLSKRKYQALVAFQIQFNFKSSADILDYLNHKVITLPNEIIAKIL